MSTRRPAPPAVPTPPTKLDPFALLAGLVLDTGKTWGQSAEAWQLADARAILARGEDAIRRHFLLRARGMSKTSDAGAIALALLLTEAPPRSRSHAYAVDADQARIMADTIAGLVERTGLAHLVEVKSSTITVRSTGASLAIEASDGASAFGLRPWLTIADELGMWPGTANYRQLWGAIVSATPKVPGSRLLAIGTAGSPSSLGAEVWRDAEASPHWRTSRSVGPAPWWTAADVSAVQSDLTDSEWRRLILCEWAEGDDALTTAEDIAACIRSGDSILAPKPGHDYIAALDVGTRRDLTALAIGHTESRESGRVVVIDRVLHWRPDRGLGGRVDLAEVEATVLRVCREYRAERLRFDRMQAEQMVGNLTRAGVKVEEYVFSSAGAARVARGLHVALRDRAIELPDDDELRAEAASVRMVEIGSGMVKMSNPPGTHDDVLTAIGMIIADFSQRPDVGFGAMSNPNSIALRMGLRRSFDRRGYSSPRAYRTTRTRTAEAVSDISGDPRTQALTRSRLP